MSSFKVYELRLKVYLLQDLQKEDTYAVFGSFLDQYLSKEEQFLKLHEKNCFKLYCFDQPYPIERDGLYKQGQIYTVRIRTVDSELARYFSSGLANFYTDIFKALTMGIKIISKKHIEQIYSITPAIIKCDSSDETVQGGGYWKKKITFEQYEERIKVNLIKKYNMLTESQMDEDFDLYRQIELLNTKPIAMPYKGIKLLGDKLRILAADNERAQELMYLAIGTGLCEMNSRGAGFVNYRYL